MSDPKGSVNELLQEASKNNPQALDDLFPIVYDELRHLARKVRRGRTSETLNTTALVHEAYLKLVDTDHWESQLHFFRTAAKAMRHILVSAARRHLAQKRGGDAPRVTFDEHIYATPMKAEKLITLDEALEELHQQDPRMAQVVECRFFAGLGIEETAAALDVSPRTVRRDWRTARAFLADKLGTSAS